MARLSSYPALAWAIELRFVAISENYPHACLVDIRNMPNWCEKHSLLVIVWLLDSGGKDW